MLYLVMRNTTIVQKKLSKRKEYFHEKLDFCARCDRIGVNRE
jgi:hypothetical protein